MAMNIQMSYESLYPVALCQTTRNTFVEYLKILRTGFMPCMSLTDVARAFALFNLLRLFHVYYIQCAFSYCYACSSVLLSVLILFLLRSNAIWCMVRSQRFSPPLPSSVGRFTTGRCSLIKGRFD